uniref:Uncharacterized protein n=1 Tax=Virgibacillus oceani TaxID=1479511 RepID=A0A917M619_9BACI|nr:hypothetical protein GCM10011398_28370 [Virgibacillus oceani]
MFAGLLAKSCESYKFQCENCENSDRIKVDKGGRRNVHKRKFEYNDG